MSKPLSFQQVILKLHEFWAQQGCVIWEPYNVQVGAGTGNPATLLRVLGPEPWRVAYVEPSVRPDDGRYGDNPNRMQKYYQYQVILKPEPGNPQELYLQSLEALGIDPRQHDIRFVEDNWESPALGAWGLGWEVWLDGQEITQFTYFQQAGGLELDPVSVEITYGLERIVLALQGKESAWAIDWMPDAPLTYADLMYQDEVEHCRYYFDIADVDRLKAVYDTYENEMKRALAGDALISAYDYVLKCSHLFNVLDTRGAIGVTERAGYFRRMREMTRMVAKAYVEKREALGHPLLKLNTAWGVTRPAPAHAVPTAPNAPADFLLEVGVEELPSGDVTRLKASLEAAVDGWLRSLLLDYHAAHVYVTPRRIVLYVRQLAPRQADEEQLVKGPPAERAFDQNGNPTPAAIGFAKGKGVDVSALTIRDIDGGKYVTALVKTVGKPAADVLIDALPKWLADIKFPKMMRWNASGVVFSRPIRWLVALLGETVIPFSYAGVHSSATTRGLRPLGSPEIAVRNPETYFSAMAEQNIYLSFSERREIILDQIGALAQEVDGDVPEDEDLLTEVTNLVESPMALRGTFEARYLALPRDVLVTVMRDKQRYFPVQSRDGTLLPYFITVRNGDDKHLDIVAKGNEHVLRARFSDAEYFFNQDIKKPLAAHLERLRTLTFHEKLGSMYDKNMRVAGLLAPLAEHFGFSSAARSVAHEAAKVFKADLGTQMVVEMTSLQGVMGREYALREGIAPEVANAIYEHWLPHSATDALPASEAGVLLALADRLDSLVGLFGAGLAPKATADPYGLRRTALGMLLILIHKALPCDLRDLVRIAAAAQPLPVDEATQHAVLEFVKGRLESWLVEETHVSRQVAAAVLAEQAHNPFRASQAASELTEWEAHAAWEVILDNFARCVRITRTVETLHNVNPDTFTLPQERNLWQAVQTLTDAVPATANVGAFLAAFERVVPTIQAFFDHVLVNSENPQERANRIGMLQRISALQRGRADFSMLSGF